LEIIKLKIENLRELFKFLFSIYKMVKDYK